MTKDQHMSEKVESGLGVICYLRAFQDGTPNWSEDAISDFPVFPLYSEDQTYSMPLVRQSDAERALQLKHEAHRKTWRQLEQVTGLLSLVAKRVRESGGVDRIILERIDDTLSQQAEPVDFEWPKLDKPAQVGAGTFCVGVSTKQVVEAAKRLYQYEQDPPFSQEQIEALRSSLGAEPEPAPAQDEREACSSTFTQGELNLIRTVLSGTVTEELVSRITAALATRPAQTDREAQGDMLHRLKQLWDEDECPSFVEVAAFLNANARPAQTEQQPVPDAVWEALQRMIETTHQLGPHSREDSQLVARYRDRYRLLAAPIAQTAQGGE